MGLPKRKVSKSRRDKRRTGKSLSAPSLSTCPECGEILETPADPTTGARELRDHAGSRKVSG